MDLNSASRSSTFGWAIRRNPISSFQINRSLMLATLTKAASSETAAALLPSTGSLLAPFGLPPARTGGARLGSLARRVVDAHRFAKEPQKHMPR